MDLFVDPATTENIKRVETSHSLFAKKLRAYPKVKNVRQTGTILAMDWETGDNTSYFNSLRDTLYNYFLDAGIILRPLGNTIYILPPYCISEEDLNYVYHKIEQALEEI